MAVTVTSPAVSKRRCTAPIGFVRGGEPDRRIERLISVRTVLKEI